MKTIVVRWGLEGPEDFKNLVMRVVASGHPSFTIGSRFDFGYFNIATVEGYTIISLPVEES